VTASVNTLSEVVALEIPPHLYLFTEAVALGGPPQ